jgi:hypothetical protein
MKAACSDITASSSNDLEFINFTNEFLVNIGFTN